MKERKRRDSLTNRKIEGVSASRNIFLKENGSPVIDFVSSPFHSAPWRNLKLHPFCRDCTPNCYTSYKCISSAHSFHGPTNPGQLSHPFFASLSSLETFFFPRAARKRGAWRDRGKKF